LIDMITHRNDLKKKLGLLLGYMGKGTKFE